MATTATPDRLLATARPLVERYCRDRLGRRERAWDSADDVAQDVHLAVFTALRAQPPDQPFRNFVQGIARRQVDAARTAAAGRWDEPVAELPEEADAEADPEARALRRELAERMKQLLRTLPEKPREILVLRVVVGLSAEETAAAVGSTAGAVRVAQHRALGQLRRALTRQPGEPNFPHA
jgi:RNA polymerase sigma-70 factor (ECF subfamily)